MVLFSIEAKFAFKIEIAISDESASMVLDSIAIFLANIIIDLPSLSTKLLLLIEDLAPSEAILIPSCSLYFTVLLIIFVNIP